MTDITTEKAEDRRHRFALDLLDTLMRVHPPGEEALREAERWLRSGGDSPGGGTGFAELLRVGRHDHGLLSRQVWSVATATRLVSEWMATAKEYRDALDDLVAGFTAIRGLSAAFAAREAPAGGVSDVWRLVAAGIEAELEAGPARPKAKPIRTCDEDGETVSVGDIAAFRAAARREGEVQSRQWSDLVLDVARAAWKELPLAHDQLRLTLGVSGDMDHGVDIPLIADAATRLAARARGLDGRFRLLPTSAMTAALGAMCLWDRWRPNEGIPSFRDGNDLLETAWGLMSMAGVGEEDFDPAAKSVARADGMEKALKAVRPVYFRLRKNPFAVPGGGGLWDRQAPKVASKPTFGRWPRPKK